MADRDDITDTNPTRRDANPRDPKKESLQAEHISAHHNQPLVDVGGAGGEPTLLVPVNRRRFLMNLALVTSVVPQLPLVSIGHADTDANMEVKLPQRSEVCSTKIGRMWSEREAIRRQRQRAERVCQKLENRLEQLMPKPDRSIIYSEENDADGLRYWGAPDREPHTLHHYIYSINIAARLEAVQPSDVDVTETDGGKTLIMRNEPRPLSDKQLALRKRLESRLELSERYERKISRVSSSIGLNAVHRKIDRFVNQQNKLDDLILRAPALTPSDLAVKVKLHDSQDSLAAVSLVRDLRMIISTLPADSLHKNLARAITAINSDG